MATSLWSFIKGVLIQNDSDRTKGLAIQVSNSATTSTQTTVSVQQTANRTITLPDATDTLVGKQTTDTFSNKTLDNSTVATIKDSNFTIQDNGDTTKQAKFEASGITTATTRTFTLPDANTTVVGTDATQTLTNKTLSGNTAASLINGSGTLNTNSTGTITVPNATDTLVAKATTDTLSNKTLDNTTALTIKDASFTLQDNGDTTKQAKFELSSITTGNTRTITVPDSDVTLASTSSAQTFSNKTLDNTNTITVKDANLTIQDDGDTTKQLKLQLSGITTGNTRTLTVPDASTTLVGTDTADALSNKTSVGVGNLSLSSNQIQATGINQLLLTTASTAQIVTANRPLGSTGKDASSTGELDVYQSSSGGGWKTAIVPGATSADTTLTLPTNTTTVVGTTSTQTLSNKTLDNTTTVTVKDANWTMQDDGDTTKQMKFQLSGITTGNTRTLTVPDATTTLVGIDNSQVITNKDIDGGTASNTSRITIPKASKTTLDGLTRKQATVVYASDLNKFYYDNGSSLKEVGSGSGGTKNYLTAITTTNGTNTGNGDFELGSTTGWSLGHVTLTSNFPSGVPTFGSGAAAALGISASATPISGTYSGNYNSLTAVTTAGDFLATDAFYIDKSDQSKTMTIKFSYWASTGPSYMNFSGTSANSYGIAVYDVTNSAWIMPAGVWGMTQSSGVGVATASFQTTSNSTQYRLVIFNANATSNFAVSLYIDDVFVGPQTAPIGPVITDWVAYTPVIVGFGSAGSPTALSRRVGDSLEVRGNFASGNSTATTASISVGFNGANSNVTIDTNKVSANTYTGELTVGHATTNYVFHILAPTSNLSTVGITVGSSATNPAAAANGNAVAVNGDSVQFYFRVPIVGWSSNVQMSNDTDTRIVAFRGTNTSFTANNTTPTVTLTSDYDTHGAYSGSTFTAPVTGKYKIGGYLRTNSVTWTAGQAVEIYYVKNGGGNIIIGRNNMPAGTFNAQASISESVSLNAGDTLVFKVYSDVSATTSSMVITVDRLSGPAVVAATESVNARYTTSAAPSFSSGAATIVNFGTVDYDSHGAVTTGASWKYTAPVSGKYSVDASITLSGVTAAGEIYLEIFKNGVFASRGPRLLIQNTSGQGAIIVDKINCNASDTLDIRLTQSNGATRSLEATAACNHVSIARIGN